MVIGIHKGGKKDVVNVTRLFDLYLIERLEQQVTIMGAIMFKRTYSNFIASSPLTTNKETLITKSLFSTNPENT